MPMISEDDKMKLLEEISDMTFVARWLDKRIGMECNAKCKELLNKTRDYVKTSIEVHWADIKNLT